jgi:Txe/YoeB family toxin of toxin-antitoxin system
MSIVFVSLALNDLMYLIDKHPKKAKKAIELIQLLHRNPHHPMLGKPEKLKHTDAFSIRLDKENRITFNVNQDKIIVLSLVGHYEK